MRIALITHGTRGDVQPLVVVAAMLRRRGHDVVLGLPHGLVSFGERLNLPVVPLAFDTLEVLDSPKGRRALAAGSFYTLTRWLAELHHARSADLDDDVLRACDGADLIVAGFLLEERAASIAERRGLPLVVLHSQPVRPSRVVAHPLVTARSSRLRPWNVVTHLLFEKVWWGRLRADTNRFRARLGVASNRNPMWRRPLPAGLAEVQLYSPALVPGLPAEWASDPARVDARFGGFISLGVQERGLFGDTASTVAVREWLAAGDPPVYVGFGSMPLIDPAVMIEMIAAVCGRLGVRALIVTGPADLANLPACDPARVYLATAVDHDFVLPRCAAAVHHGGAGTLAASLRAGLPTMVCSFFVDQPFWGRQVEKLGVGTHVRFAKLTPRSLERGMRRLLDPDIRGRAADLGVRLRAEPDGAEVVADLVESLLHDHRRQAA